MKTGRQEKNVVKFATWYQVCDFVCVCSEKAGIVTKRAFFAIFNRQQSNFSSKNTTHDAISLFFSPPLYTKNTQLGTLVPSVSSSSIVVSREGRKGREGSA